MKNGIYIIVKVSLAIAGAGLLILGYPPFGFWPCVIMAWACLFLLVLHSSKRSSFYLGLLFGFLAYGGTLLWLRNVFGTAAIPLYGILSVFVILPALLASHFNRHFESPWLRTIFLASLFSAFEFFRCELFFLRFPWISAGSSLAPNWLTPIIGVYGCSFLVFTTAAFLAVRGTRVAGIGLVVVIFVLCIFKPPFVVPDSTKAIKAAVIQGEELNFDEYLDLSKKTLHQHPRLIVWPEYALPYDVREKEPMQVDELQNLARIHDTIFIFGTKTATGNGDKEWRNTALTIGGGGVLGEYFKNHPVHFFNDGIAGTTADPIKTPIGLIGTEVCFDCDYENVTRELVSKGAEFIVAPTFDAMQWSETQHMQHSVFFKLRAAENRRWLICSASSGYSRIIDPHGHVHESLPFGGADAIVGKIVPLRGRTFYNRIGWLFPWLIMLSTIALCISCYSKTKVAIPGRPEMQS